MISMFPSLDFEGLCLIHFCVPNVSFPGGSLVKNLPGNAGDMDLILGWEDTLEKEMANHSSILAWKIPWTEETGRLQDN